MHETFWVMEVYLEDSVIFFIYYSENFCLVHAAMILASFSRFFSPFTIQLTGTLSFISDVDSQRHCYTTA